MKRLFRGKLDRLILQQVSFQRMHHHGDFSGGIVHSTVQVLLLIFHCSFLLSQIIESEPSGWGEPPPVVDHNTLDLVPAVQRGALERWNLAGTGNRDDIMVQGEAAA